MYWGIFQSTISLPFDTGGKDFNQLTGFKQVFVLLCLVVFIAGLLRSFGILTYAHVHQETPNQLFLPRNI